MPFVAKQLGKEGLGRVGYEVGLGFISNRRIQRKRRSEGSAVTVVSVGNRFTDAS